MSLSEEDFRELRKCIQDYISKTEVHSHIEDVVKDCIRKEKLVDGNSRLNHELLLKKIEREGVVDELMKRLQLDVLPPFLNDGKDSDHSKQVLDANTRDCHLELVISRGSAFLEYINCEDVLPGQKSSSFTIHVDFLGQRFTSRPTPCLCEPDFNESFRFDLGCVRKGNSSSWLDTTSLMSVSDPINVVLIRNDPPGSSTLISSHDIGWRRVLTSEDAEMKMMLELYGIGCENNIGVGILDAKLRLEIKDFSVVDKNVLDVQLNLERNRLSERRRLFLVYAKQWWKEYLAIRTGHGSRLVKIFAPDENGTNLPACVYVKAIRCGRLIETPREASWFVSLFDHQPAASVAGTGGNGRQEFWSSVRTLLCRKRGDHADRAVLLCSLLVGFGLDAYVCVGTKLSGDPHTWVVTLGSDGFVCFWEPSNGRRYAHVETSQSSGGRSDHRYSTIGCVFNDSKLFANSQPTDSVSVCRFELKNSTMWKAMSEDAIQSVTFDEGRYRYPVIEASSLDPIKLSDELEEQIKVLVTHKRNDIGLTTRYDRCLSHLLSPALSSYETERKTGLSCGNEEFQQAIHNYVADGYTFKGYPIRCNGYDARRVYNVAVRSPICKDIVESKGDDVRIAIRGRVYVYPEDLTSCWVMFAATYRSVL